MSLLTAEQVKSLNLNRLFYVVDNVFGVSVTQSQHETRILMKMFYPVITTDTMPLTGSILEELLPSILGSTCFNEENLTFLQEVKNTEMGHLFEHILLEFLCEEKLAEGYEEAIFSGRTNWNWQNDPQGTFHITIDAGYEEAKIFPVAIKRTVQLMKVILEKHFSDLTEAEIINYSLPQYLEIL